MYSWSKLRSQILDDFWTSKKGVDLYTSIYGNWIGRLWSTVLSMDCIALLYCLGHWPSTKITKQAVILGMSLFTKGALQERSVNHAVS